MTNQQTLGASSAIGLLGGGNQNAALEAQQNNLAAGAAGTAGLVGAGAQSNSLSALAQLFNQYQTQSSFAPALAGSTAGNATGSALGGLFAS